MIYVIRLFIIERIRYNLNTAQKIIAYKFLYELNNAKLTNYENIDRI